MTTPMKAQIVRYERECPRCMGSGIEPRLPARQLSLPIDDCTACKGTGWTPIPNISTCTDRFVRAVVEVK